MSKRIMLGCLVLACVAWLPVHSALGMTQKTQPPTLLVVPAHYSQLQVAFDIANRYDTLLVSYQGNANTPEPLLHVWNGQKWLQISMNEYREASFVRVRPDRVFLIGDDHTLPSSLVAASGWAPVVMDIPSSATSEIVNSFGRANGFRSSDWKWFATRYNLDIEDLNAEARTSSWYDRPASSVKREPLMQGRSKPAMPPRRQATTDIGAPAVPAPRMQSRAPVPAAEMVTDDLPSIDEVQRSIEASMPSEPSPAWRERAVATDIPVK